MATPQAVPIPPVSREGDELRVLQGATLPNFCIKCGAPATKHLDKNFFWHNPWLYALILFNLIIYAIVAMIVRKKLHLLVPLCDQHYSARRRNMAIGIVMMIIWLPMGIAGSAAGGDLEPFAWLLGVAVFFAGVIVTARAAAVLRPRYIDVTYGKFTGVAPEFLARIGV